MIDIYKELFEINSNHHSNDELAHDLWKAR